MNGTKYILVTAARNEAAHIDATIHAVAAQSMPPERWIIVSDGSTDGTDDRVRRQADHLPFLELLRVEADGERNFGSKARAINAGYDRLRDLDFRLIGALDADVTFRPDFFAGVIDRMLDDPLLGIAGGVVYDEDRGRWVPQITDTEWSVSGPVQLFRRECFESIGGYLPIRGGVDAAAEVMARMRGWKVHAFPELQVLHHRLTGAEKHSRMGVFFHRGLEDYQLGYHPLFFFARAARRVRERPWALGALTMLAGFAAAAIRRRPVKLPPEVVRFLRAEQMDRLRACFCRKGGSA